MAESCTGIDAVIKLFHLLIQYSQEKITITRNILSRIIYSLHNMHSTGNFDQRPYLRLIVGLLKQHHTIDPIVDTQQLLILMEVFKLFFLLISIKFIHPSLLFVRNFFFLILILTPGLRMKNFKFL
jgi:hypothetical protein